MRLQEDAKSIKEALLAAHSQHPSRQTAKIVADFEVRMPAWSREQLWFMMKPSCSTVYSRLAAQPAPCAMRRPR